MGRFGFGQLNQKIYESGNRLFFVTDEGDYLYFALFMSQRMKGAGYRTG